MSVCKEGAFIGGYADAGFGNRVRRMVLRLRELGDHGISC